MADGPNFLNSTPEQITKQHLFSLSGSKNVAPSGPDPALIEEISGIDRRLKLLENSIGNMRSKLENVESNELQNTREDRRDIKTLEQENDELKATIRDIKENIKLIIQDLESFAKQEDFQIMKNYLDLWNPINFVTAEQVKKLAKDVFEEMREEEQEEINNQKIYNERRREDRIEDNYNNTSNVKDRNNNVATSNTNARNNNLSSDRNIDVSSNRINTNNTTSTTSEVRKIVLQDEKVSALEQEISKIAEMKKNIK